jgi:2-methylcitrate dehydratase PrpD
MNIQQELTKYISLALQKELPKKTQIKTRFHLLDTIVSILTGRLLPSGKKAFYFSKQQGGIKESTLLGNDIKVSAINAGFSNGMAAHANETDDSHTKGRFHPGCAIIPTTIAIAEKQNLDSDNIIKAIALGYDVGVRLTTSLGYETPKTTTFATHSLGPIFGSAASAGALLKLTHEQCNYLISYTAQQASGLACWNRDPDHIEKAFVFSGMTSRNAIYSALLAKENFTSVTDPLLGERGFHEGFAHNSKPELLVEKLGENFEIDNASLKKWSVGSPIQSMMDAIEYLIKHNDFHFNDIKELTVEIPTDRFHIVNDREIPSISAQHLIAVHLIRKTMGYEEAHNENLFNDPDVVNLRKKIKAISSEELAMARPERQSKITIILNNGKELFYHAKSVRGTPDNQMNEDDIVAKAKRLLSVFKTSQTDDLIDLILHKNFSTEHLTRLCNLNIKD